MLALSVKVKWEMNAEGGIRLLPNLGPVNLNFDPTYDHQGRFEFDKAIDELERQARAAWEFPVVLREHCTSPGGVYGYLKDVMVERHIQAIPDVLADFSYAPSGLDRENPSLLVPLRMKSSGYRLSIDCTPGLEGKSDDAAVADALAQAYRDVFQLASGRQVFSASQHADLTARITAWLEELMQQAGIVWPLAEVDLESADWEGDALRLWVNVHTSKVVKYDLLVPMNSQGDPDFSNIERVAVEIAKDWATDRGLGSAEWLCAKIVAQIRPDAEEYAQWIIQEEDKIREEFWRAMNQEMEAQLQKADELLAKAKKWRADVTAWAEDTGNYEILEKNDLPDGAGIIVKTPEVPSQFKTSFDKIWEGLSKLPGAVWKGVKPHLGEMKQGLEFGFRAAGVVIDEAIVMVVKDVADAAFWAIVPEKGKLLLSKYINVGSRKAKYIFHIYDAVFFAKGRRDAYKKIVKELNESGDRARRVSKRIEKIKNELYLQPKK